MSFILEEQVERHCVTKVRSVLGGIYFKIDVAAATVALNIVPKLQF